MAEVTKGSLIVFILARRNVMSTGNYVEEENFDDPIVTQKISEWTILSMFLSPCNSFSHAFKCDLRLWASDF